MDTESMIQSRFLSETEKRIARLKKEYSELSSMKRFLCGEQNQADIEDEMDGLMEELASEETYRRNLLARMKKA